MEGQKPEVKSDEIDLGQLFSRLGSGMRARWMGFMRFLATMRRVPLENKLLFILILAASIIIGYSYSSMIRKRFYESSMIISSDYLNKRLAENIVEKLAALAAEPSKHGLAISLGLPDSVVQEISWFEVEPFMVETDIVDLEVLKEQLRTAATTANKEVIEKVVERIEVENRNSYQITVRTLSPGVITKLEDAIVHYFQKNPYLKKRIEITHENLLERKARLGRDISRMDSLKIAIYQYYSQNNGQSKASANLIVADKTISGPAEIFTQGLDIYDLYEEVNRDLYTHKDFEVVDGFTQFSEPANARLSTILVESFLIGLLVAYLLVGLRNFNIYLANLK